MRAPPIERIGILRWLHKNLFNNWINTLITTALMVLLVILVPPLISWAFINSVWNSTDPQACVEAGGACWAVIAEKHRVMLFGFYPYAEQWRPFLAVVIYLGVLVITALPVFWNWRILLPLWVFGIITIITLMLGGVFGLPVIETAQWGGLPLTMIVFSGQVSVGMPLAVLLALGRRSEKLPILKTICIVVIETMRAIPPVTVLLIAAVIFPIFLPTGFDIDKMVRIVLALGFYFACLQAEVIRGGLQAVPVSQLEAGKSIGLSAWQINWLIVLPQAIRIVIPGLMNHIIQAFKNSTLVIIVGLFDILNATSASVADPQWISYFTEAYLFVALVYFSGAYSLSKYSKYLEKKFKVVSHQ
ncbi:MAG: amino acid ABC transporter permease [marine bacterium B5-7]|nr:MAG: amino acid ABC transporter permease [marine bacterium B5-7]